MIYSTIAIFKDVLLGLGTLCAQLLVQDRNVVIPLSLVEVSSDRVAQIVLCGEFGDGELGPVIAAGVGQTRLVELQFPVLFVDEENVAVQSRSFRWTGANVCRQGLTALHS